MRHWILAALLMTALFVTACSGAAAPATEAATEAPAEAEAPAEVATGAAALPEVNPLEVSGDIIMAGSSTVYPLAEAMAERFIAEGYAGNITIDSIGTGAGFQRFCEAGETDIATASRPVKETEIESCAAIGRTPVEIRSGTDALAIVVNPANGWSREEGQKLEEIDQLFFAEGTNWSDVDPAWVA